MPNLDTLAQVKIPAVFAKVQRKGYADLMNITGETRTQSAGGEQIKSASPNVYEDIPVTYEPVRVSSINSAASDRAVSLNEYILTFPTHIYGTRIDIDVKNHRLKIQARGNEPEKTFRIEAIRDNQGVLFEAVCIKEN